MTVSLFRKKGLTIVEMVVVVAVSGVALTFLTTVLYGNWIGYSREILAADRQFEARVALDKISRDIRESENVILDPNSLTLTLSGVDVVYQINNNGQLTRQEGSDPVRILCEHVKQDESGFQWSGPKAIDIDIQLVQPEGVFNSGGTKNVVVKLQSNVQRRHL